MNIRKNHQVICRVVTAALMLALPVLSLPASAASGSKMNPHLASLLGARPDGTIPPFTLDTYEDCNTVALNPALNPAAPNYLRGSSGIIEGLVYPGGTFPVDTNPNDFYPVPPGTPVLGHWFSRFTFLISLDQNIAGDSPIAYVSMIHQLPDDSQAIYTEGMVANLGSPAVERVVIGGTGVFSGASGTAREETVSQNDSGCFVERFTFSIKLQTRW